MDNKSKYIRSLATVIDSQIDKHEYLLARYLNDVSVSLRNDWCYNNYFVSYGFDPIQDEDLQKSANINVIRSVIDTLVSNIANEKVRPYFTPVGSDYETKRLVRHVQKYFDVVFDNEHVQNKSIAAFLSSTIFGSGYIWVNPFSYKIENLPAWTVGLLHTEELYGMPTKMLVKMMNYPSTLLEQNYSIKSNSDYVTLSIYVDSEEGIAELYIGTELKKKTKLSSKMLPLVEVRYTKNIFGNKSRGVVEELDGIQTQIDLINAKISAAAQLTSANTTYVLEGSNLKPSDVDNRVGKVYGIKMPPGVNAPPVVNVTPVPFDPMWQKLLDYYIDQAYKIIGVNKLDAQSEKPQGLDSGVALQTMEDISNNRFETQLQSYISIYTELAQVIISIMPDDSEILPDNTSAGITWKDIKKSSDLFNIQYSAVTALSKSPQERLKQIIQLSEIGLIGADKVATYLDSPDFTDALSGATAISDAIDNCIQLAIDGVSYEIPQFIAWQKLAEEIAITQNQLWATINKDNIEVVQGKLENLKKLETKLSSLMETSGFIDTTQEAEHVETALGNISTQPNFGGTTIADYIEPSNNDQQLEPNLGGIEVNDITNVEES